MTFTHPELLARREQLLDALRQSPNLMRGSLNQLRVRCGAPNCFCATGPGHLKTHFTVSLRKKTRTLYVNQERRAEIEALTQGYARLWELVNDLTEVNLALLRAQQPTPTRRRRSGARRPA